MCYYDAENLSEPGFDAQAYDWKLFEYLKKADWIVDLNPRPLLNFFSGFAGTLGTQWSCFNLPPNTDEYNAARRHLVPYPKDGLVLKNVEPIAESIVKHLATPFTCDLDRDRNIGSYLKRTNKFIKALNLMFGVKGSRNEK